LKIQILNYSGDYEIYVSIKTERPSALVHDYYFTHDDKTLVISYPEMKSNWIYISIYGKIFTTLMIEARFNGNYEEKNITNKVKNMLFSRKNQFEQTRQENKCE
jgi:hypothetical protein